MKVRRKVSAKATAAMKEVLAWVSALIVIIPFLIVVFNSFKTAHESINMSLTLPNALHWENFRRSGRLEIYQGHI